MKKSISSIITICFVFGMMFNFTFADEISNSGIESNSESTHGKYFYNNGELKDKYYSELLSLGFTDKMINFLENREIPDIIKNNLSVESVEDCYTLIINYDMNDIDETAINEQSILANNSDKSSAILNVSVELTEEEVTQYLKNKENFIMQNAQTLNHLQAFKGKNNVVVNGTIDKNEYTNNPLYNIHSSQQENRINFGVIRTQLYILTTYDVGGDFWKKIALDFEWVDHPTMLFEDAMGLSHTGRSLGFTNIYDSGLYTVSEYGVRGNWNHDWTDYGIKGTFMWNKSGRLWMNVGNRKASIKNDAYFSAFGKYGHTSFGLGTPSVTLSTGGVAINAGLGSTLTETTQVKLNNIYTYK